MRMTSTHYQILKHKLWNCYQTTTKRAFSQRLRRLIQWAKTIELPERVIKKLEKVQKNRAFYNNTLQYSEAHRTSNMLDRLMNRMDKSLYNTQYFHGNNLKMAELRIKAAALIHNFAPYDKRVIIQNDGWQSPAEKLNQFRYHNNWLQNLLISANRTQFL